MPSFTLRDNTKRPVTITEGTNVLVGSDARTLEAAYRTRGTRTAARVPELWDGHAGERIAEVLVAG